MDLQEARDRRDASLADPSASRRATTHKRARDARLRRAIREAFARQKELSSAPVDADQAPLRLHVVGDDMR